MQCPKCSTAMSSLEGLAFSADRCNGCGGVWLSDSDIDVKDHAVAIDSIDTSIQKTNLVSMSCEKSIAPTVMLRS